MSSPFPAIIFITTSFWSALDDCWTFLHDSRLLYAVTPKLILQARADKLGSKQMASQEVFAMQQLYACYTRAIGVKKSLPKVWQGFSLWLNLRGHGIFHGARHHGKVIYPGECLGDGVGGQCSGEPGDGPYRGAG